MYHIAVSAVRADSCTAPMSGLPYEFPQCFEPSPSDPPSSWDQSPYLSHSPHSLDVDRRFSEETSSSLWRPGRSPMDVAHPPSQFPANSSMSMGRSSQDSRESFAPLRERDGRSWHPPPAPARSMSLVTPDELPAHYQARYFQSPIASGTGPSALAVHASTHYGQAGPYAALSEPHSATDRHGLARQGYTGQMAGYHFPPWSLYQQQNTQLVDPGAEGFPHDWYAGSSDQGQDREDTGSSHYYQMPFSPPTHHRKSG